MQQMHSELLNAKLKNLERVLKESESTMKKYINVTSKAIIEPYQDPDISSAPGIIQFDEQLYNKLLKVMKEAKVILAKNEIAIDGCFEKLNEIHKPPNGKRKSKDPDSPRSSSKKKRSGSKPSGIGTPPPATPPSPTPSGGYINNYVINTNYVIPIGDLVAARAPASDQWILAKVLAYNPKTGRYEVEDSDPEEDDPSIKRFLCGPEDVIALPPDAASVPPNALGPVAYLYNAFPAKTSVLAMFPQTTTFYPAKVVTCHKKSKVVQFYQLQFEDDNDDGGMTPSRKVNAQYVIPYPNR